MRWYVLATYLLILSGCAARPYYLTADKQSSSLKVVEGEGMSTLASLGNESDVHLSPSRAQTGELRLDLQFGNHAAESVVVSPDQIQVFEIKADGSSKPLKKYTQESYLKKCKQRVNSKGFALDVMDGVFQVGGAVAGGLIGDGGALLGVGQQIVSGVAGGKLRGANQAEAVWGAQVCNQYLRKHTLEPHTQTSATLITDASRSDRYKVDITIGSDTHVFYLSKPDQK